MGVVVPTRIHRQNDDRYCGAACAQMALAALGMNPSSLAQRELFEASHDQSHPVHWYAHPHTLTSALNDRWRNAHHLRFRLFHCADKAGVSYVMRRTFEQFGQQGAVAIALTGLSRHWVVVRGFETDPADPSGPTLGFHLRNPLPAIRPNSEDWPHSEDDDCCVGHRVCPFCHYVSLAHWNSSLQPVNVDGPWQGEFLVICPDTYVPGTPDEEIVPPTPGMRVEPPPPTGPILSTREIAAHVEQMIAENPFASEDCIVDAIRLTRPGTPILVEGLNEDGSNDPDGAYYLVPFLDPEGDWGDPDSVPMAMTVNAVTGEFEEVIAAPDGSIYDPDWITPAGIERQARSNRMDTVRRRAQPDSDFAYLAVWRPSLQTPTRFWPLFIEDRPATVEADGDLNAPAYMRIDGQVVTDLDDLHP